MTERKFSIPTDLLKLVHEGTDVADISSPTFREVNAGEIAYNPFSMCISTEERIVVMIGKDEDVRRMLSFLNMDVMMPIAKFRQFNIFLNKNLVEAIVNSKLKISQELSYLFGYSLDYWK